ncbi:unnamed protein product [Adineta steineri]|uniref:Uncharacterized protein n=1 Tax=Adineta steineri TaxID=433720 RepID=A0A814BBR0_9BILA|nr:unnamed protein product [Adineta steineri]CAF0991002.1 unnamed protein product [Adineta steineri]
MLIRSLPVIMGPKPIKKNNQKDDTANSMSELAFGSTVDEFETGQEDEEYWLDENDEKQLDEMATGYTEMMALTENLRPGWKIFEVGVATDISSLDESVNKSTQENNDPTNNLSVDNKEQKSNNKPQGSSKRKPDCLTPPKPATGPNKATRGDSDAPVASSKSTNTSSSTNSNQKKLQSTSDTSNSADSKDVQKEPDTLSTKEQICSTTQSSGLASANDEQPIQKLKSLVGERIDAHWQHKNIREIFYNGNQKDTEKIFRQLLEKLSKYNNKSGNDTLLRALTQRGDNPAFLTAAEVDDGRRLNDYMSQEIEVDGTKVTRRKLAYQKGVETRKKEFQKDGRTTNTYEQAGRKISATRTRKFQKPDGSWATIATEAVEKSTATMAKEFQNVDGTTTTIFNERSKNATKTRTTTMVTLENGCKVNIDQKGASNPENEHTERAPGRRDTSIFERHGIIPTTRTTPYASPSPTSASLSTPPLITPSTSPSTQDQTPRPSSRSSLVFYNTSCPQEYHQTTVNLSNDSDSDQVTQC